MFSLNVTFISDKSEGTLLSPSLGSVLFTVGDVKSSLLDEYYRLKSNSYRLTSTTVREIIASAVIKEIPEPITSKVVLAEAFS